MNYFFCHQQKTGGLSLIEEIKASEKYHVFSTIDFFKKYDNDKNSFVTGHNYFSLLNLIKSPVTPIVFLREPSKRIISWWNHVLWDNDKSFWSPREYHLHHYKETDPAKILQDPIFDKTINNQMTRKLGQDFDYSKLYQYRNDENFVNLFKKANSIVEPPNETHLRQAKKNLKKSIIGIQEMYNESINEIANILEIEIKKFHVTQPRATFNPLVGHDDIINGMNYLDYELWEYGKELFKNDHNSKFK